MSQPARNGPHRMDFTGASADDDDELYRLEVEQSRLKQHGPVPNRVRARRTGAIFKFRREKIHRTHRVFKLISKTFKEAVGKTGRGSVLLENLNLKTRGHRALLRSEATKLADVVMAEVNRVMKEEGFKGLDVPLVEIELLHLRMLMKAEPWSPADKATGRKDVTDPDRDALFYRLYRRNSSVVLHEANMVIYPFASAFGLQNVKMRPATSEFLAKGIELRERTVNGVLKLTADEITELEEDKELKEMILTKLSEDSLSSLMRNNSVPWLRSHTAVQILSSMVMGIEDWNGLLHATCSRLAKYGSIALAHSEDPVLSKFKEEMENAVKEHNSPIHTMVRLLGAALGTNRRYFTIAQQPDLPDKKLKLVANGTRFVCCIVASKRSVTGKVEYGVFVQGSLVMFSKSLTKSYHHLFLLQNLLFLDGKAGTNDMSGLVESINRLCWGVEYKNRKKTSASDKLLSILDKLDREDTAKKLLRRSQ